MDDTLGFQQIYWEEARDEVQAINPGLARAIDAVDPDKRHPLVRARYRFGDLIVKNGEAFLPSPEGVVPTYDQLVQHALGDQLSYSSIPLFLVLKNTCEVFIDLPSRAVPLNLLYPGSFLGLFESMDAIFKRTSSDKWSVSAGARNIFTLPKISEINGFNALKMRYGLSDDMRPESLMSHWRLFSAIAAHSNFQQPWYCDVLFFTKNWLINSSNVQTDFDWSHFKYFLFSNAWHQAQFAISKINMDAEWEQILESLVLRRLKPLSYLTDQIKHILLIASKRWPGFKPADTLDQAAPVSGLQKVITEEYGLKKYYPTILHTSSLEQDINAPLYCSLLYPVLLEGFPADLSTSTLMSTLRQIKILLDTIEPVLNNTRSGREKVNFDYFHVETDKYGEIKKSDQLPPFDKRLLENASLFPERTFCASSSFWKGAVCISKSKF